MLESFDHALIAVRDLETAAAHYEQMLGRRRSWRGAHPDMGTENALFKLANGYIELLAPARPGPVTEALERRLDSQGEGLVGMAFGTGDAEACAETLRQRGLAVAEVRPGEGRDLETGAVRRWQNVMLSPAETRGLTLFAIQHLSPPEALPDALPQAESGVIDALDHIVINTVDPEAAISLYGGKLGIRLALDRRFDARGVRLLFFRIGGVTIELAASLGDDRPAATPDRFFGLAYRVADAHAARARITSAGFDASEIRDGNKPGTLVCTVRSLTHGVPTLLIEPTTRAG
jgi:catechol 2,3-dioxygenase-like lactoylglutathione lyase family enzyme